MQLEELAGAAEEHARREHGLEIGTENVEIADRALRAEVRDGPLENLAACYGAWLGRIAVRRWGAQWVGLSEPVPPRLLIGGVLASPVDAVRRRLQDPAAPSIPEIARQLEQWARAPEPSADANREAWDRLADDPRFAGELDPGAALDDWLRTEGVAGKAVLCLGAGGGRHGPLLARAGAKVTVVDVSDRQLEHDRRSGLDLRIVRASMDDLGVLEPASFDIVVQPVSACYLPDVRRVYAEVARVLRPGGLYVAQHKQPAGLQASGREIVHPCRDGAPLPPDAGEPGMREFIHSLDALLGGLCAAGFVIEDFSEPPRADALAPAGSPGHRAWFLPPYLKVKARRTTST